MVTAEGTWCPRTTDDAMIGVQGAFPPGPAFHSVEVEGTVQYHYWRAFANVLGYTYNRLCDYVDEFYCASVNESRDQWIEEYGLNDECDPYGFNLCMKVAAQGGSTCDYFVEMAAISGYVVECRELKNDPEPIAGCFEVGCTPLGPTPVFGKYGSNLGFGQIGICNYGEVVEHPEVKYWENGQTFQASCPVPGSNLGFGPDADESCCFICGWYDLPPKPFEVVPPDYCNPLAAIINFECPARNEARDDSPDVSFRTMLRGMDDNGNYSEWGLAYVWEVTVDTAASKALQITQTTTHVNDWGTTSQAGDFMVGSFVGLPDGTPGCGTPLCTESAVDTTTTTYAICFLNRLKPAHTILNVKVTEPS